MTISIFDLFSIGVGPSSSHTVGPMRAAAAFVAKLIEKDILPKVDKYKIELFGSLALTGHGHGTDFAVVIGSEDNLPENVDPVDSHKRFDNIKSLGRLNLAGKKDIAFEYAKDLIFHYDKFLPNHANAVRFTVYDKNGQELDSNIYYSIGGGFIVEHNAFKIAKANDNNLGDAIAENHENKDIPYYFRTAKKLLEICKSNNKTIPEIIFANEQAFHPNLTDKEIKDKILNIWHVMDRCIAAGISNTGILPGDLKVKRRAKILNQKINENKNASLDTIDKLSLYSIAVNEENAAGGKVVTAPTNGAAGVIPAVLKYYTELNKNTKTKEELDNSIIDYLLTTAAIGILYKEQASISAAEVGCQGEVGVACSMAAAGYTAINGGTLEQIENAAEIGMEHHLGLTCDPIGGLVQIPCIERNAMGATQAVSSSRLALLGDGSHFVSLDKVIKTMFETGKDMMSKYKETAQGGLAVNMPEC